MSFSINTNYNYTLHPDKNYSIESDNYKINYHDSTYKAIYEIFEKLSWDITQLDNFKTGSIYFKNNILPIDLTTLTNKTALTTIANIWNKQTKAISDIQAPISNFSYNSSIDNMYNIIGSFKKELEVYPNRETKYFEIYNSEYAKYVYRAKRKYNIQLIDNIIKNNNKPYQIPVFSFDSVDNADQINIYMKLRNIEIPFKIIKTSSHNGINSYIAIYPEYLLKTYQEWYDSIMYIKLDKGTIIDNKIYYDYLIDTSLLPDGEQSISHLATLRSNNTFF